MSLEVKTLCINTSGISGTQPLVLIPAFGGDITVLNAYITGTGGGTPIGLKLIGMTNAYKPVAAGTIAVFDAASGTYLAGTLTMAAGSAYPAYVITPRFTANQWIAAGAVSGAVMDEAWITINYVQGV